MGLHSIAIITLSRTNINSEVHIKQTNMSQKILNVLIKQYHYKKQILRRVKKGRWFGLPSDIFLGGHQERI